MLRHTRIVIAAALLVVLVTIPIYFRLGHEFMPPLNEGVILYMPTTLPGISVTEVYTNEPFDMEISGRNIECTGDKKTRVSFGGVEVSAADVSCATSGNILNPNPPSALKVHVHALVDGEYDVALTSDRTGDTANSSSLAAPMQGLLIQDHVRVIAFSPSEVRQSGAFTLTIAGSSFDEHARVFLDSHELTGAVRQSDRPPCAAAGFRRKSVRFRPGESR